MQQVSSAPGLAVGLCALGLEYSALRSYIEDVQQQAHRMGTRFEVGVLQGTRWRLVLGLIGEGNMAAAAIAERAVADFDPDLLLFVGVAGALKDDIALGDVVVATRIDAYQGGKAANEFLARPVTWSTNHRLEQLARHVALNDLWHRRLAGDDR